jgi:anhydro-N-acetylmuramic acid kinase
MSGTSADGVDVAITRIEGRALDMRARLVHHHHRAYEPSLRNLIFQVREAGSASLPDLARLGREISLTYAATVSEALAKANESGESLAAVAAHGQTLFHDPPNTIQWLDPALIAAEVGCPIVSDFRRADCAAGGQGAPLVPFADFILFRHSTRNRVLLNIGGIANLTWLKAGGTLADVIAFDTGPGNCVADHVCRRHDPLGPGMDVGGQEARLAMPSREALHKLLADPFIRAKPPKSTDVPAMIRLFESIQEMQELSYLERLATATVFATGAIQLSLAAFLPAKPDELIVSGGGTSNFTIMTHLRRGFTEAGQVLTVDDLGIPSSAKEAIAFALLGAATLDGLPSNIPSVTGAKRAVVLGSITPKPG